jgi:hypothetical protein
MVGDGLVVVGRVIARGKASGLQLDSGWSAYSTYREGLCIKSWDWLDRDEAWKAAQQRGRHFADVAPPKEKR